MDKNTVKGLLLMAVVLIVFMMINRPSKEQIEAARKAKQEQADAVAGSGTAFRADTLIGDEYKQLAEYIEVYGKNGVLKNSDLDARIVQVDDSTTTVAGTVMVNGKPFDIEKIAERRDSSVTPEQRSAAATALKRAVSHYGKYKSFAPSYYGTAQTVTFGTDSTNMKLTFTTKGAMVQEVVLNKYLNERVSDSAKVMLFNGGTDSYGFTLSNGSQLINTADLYFDKVEKTDSSLTMTLALAPGVEMAVKYTIDQARYLVKMDITQKGMDAVIPPSTNKMEYKWHQDMMRNEIGASFENRYSCIYYQCVGEGPDDLNANKDVKEEITGSVKWVGFKNQFFSSVVVADGSFENVSLDSKKCADGSQFVKKLDMKAQVSYNTTDGKVFGATYYFGPNSYPLLSKIDDAISPEGDDLHLNKLVPLGWGIFGWINKLIVIPVFTFLSSFISNYGIIILLLTIFIKLILFPFTYKSYKSQAKMRLLAPEIKAINEKYPDKADAMKRQQETMALYSRAGASPFSGCLPMLLQMPVLIAMFSFFPSAIELRGQSFLWVHDLSAPDYICALPFKIPFYGDHVSLFCLLMTVTNIVYTRITMQNQPSNSSMPSMKWMMYLMPVMFLFFFNDYAAALSYYYFLSLLITVAQTYIIRHFIIDEEKVRAEMLANAKNPKKKKGGFMARLEAAQKKQEAYMREQAKQNARKRR